MVEEKRTNLIVNYLPNTLSQEDVKKIFESIGEIQTCKLIRNKITGQSLGYAFIDYVNEEAAATAVSTLTGREMDGKRLKVSFARQSGEESKDCNIYIANLPVTVSEEELLDLFSAYGDILSHKVLSNADGSSRGAGFVRFGSKEGGDLAIKEMNGKTLPGCKNPLVVKVATTAAAKQEIQFNSLNSITTSSLAGLGVAARVPNVRFNPMAGRPQPQTNTSINDAIYDGSANPIAAAISGLSAHVAQNSGAPVLATAGPTSVYVYGLQFHHSELTLYELFAPFGAIMNVKLARDVNKMDKPSKGYGFVNFAKVEDAYGAITSLNGVPFDGKALQVKLKDNKNKASTQTSQFVQPSPLAVMPGYSVG